MSEEWPIIGRFTDNPRRVPLPFRTQAPWIAAVEPSLACRASLRQIAFKESRQIIFNVTRETPVRRRYS